MYTIKFFFFLVFFFCNMDLVFFICACLILLTFLSLCAQQLPELRASVLAYGKLNLKNKDRPTTAWAHFLSSLQVPKHYFGHFYSVGLLTAILSFVQLSLDQPGWTRLLSSDQAHLSRRQCLVGLTMMTCHLIRRVYESYWIERPSPGATMHLSHYLVGLGFYGAMVLGTWLEGRWIDRWDPNADPFRLTDGLAVALFLYASVHQHRCHVILARLRQSQDEVYRIPRGDWFESIVAPHYFADILVYLSLCIVYRFQNAVMCCGLVWTIVNLSIVANETEGWYKIYFGTHYSLAFPQGRWKIIPGCY